MTSKRTWTTLLTVCIIAAVYGQTQPPSAPSFGDVRVAAVNRLDEHVRIFCDIPDLPPVIGRDIPVRINGLTPSDNPQDNLDLLMFLNDLLLAKTDRPETIVLRDIRRGREFCLIADIEVDGKDLCELLIENKLADKIIRVPASTPDASSPEPSAGAASSGAAASNAEVDAELIASRSSKVYHRGTCPHAKRMDRSKAVVFSSRTEAENTGRRPCETCKP